MSSLSLRLPDSLHNSVRKLARQEHTSLNQFIILAVAEKMSALATEDYLRQRGLLGSRKKFLQVLKSAPDVEPEEFDAL